MPLFRGHQTFQASKQSKNKESQNESVQPLQIPNASIIPSTLKTSSFTPENPSFLHHRTRRAKMNQSIVPVARLIGPAIFEASKLKVLFIGVEEEKQLKLPRTCTLTHSDITSKLTLTTIPRYNKFQRDEVLAEWKKIKGVMSPHVHCHISGGHFFLASDTSFSPKNFQWCWKAFVHGDEIVQEIPTT